MMLNMPDFMQYVKCKLVHVVMSICNYDGRVLVNHDGVRIDRSCVKFGNVAENNAVSIEYIF